MPTIKLTQGYKAIVDPIDYESLSQFRWHILKARNLLYAARTLDKKNYLLHHAIARNMGLEVKKGQTIGFSNHNGLDCRRINICLKQKAEKTKQIKIARKLLLTVRLHPSEAQDLLTLARIKGFKNLSEFVRELPELIKSGALKRA